jgi:glycogen operon protein
VANGENNKDGTNAYLSENYGGEGETKDAEIETVRKRQVKNFLLTLLISRGVPMILGGDEFRRTQGGNNNAYCQDNETGWVDWTGLEKHREIHRFAQGMIAFRGAHPILSREEFYKDDGIHWFGLHGKLPNWIDPKCKRIACFIPEKGRDGLYLMFNADTEAADFGLPPLPSGYGWRLAVDTFLPSPKDLTEAGKETPLENSKTYRVESRSGVILLVRKKK